MDPQLPDEAPEEQELGGLLDEAPCGFLTLSTAGTVTRANLTLATMVRRQRGEIVGHHIDRLLAPSGRIFFSTHLFPLLRVQHVAEEIYLPMLDADGGELPMLVNGRVRQEAGDLVFDLVLVPMRQRNQMESELIAARNVAQEAVAAKDRFLSVVSHELRSPLTGISGYAELLLRGHRGPLTDEQRRYAERIRDAAQYQARLIEDILDFAAIRGPQEVTPVMVEVEEVLSRAEAILMVRAEEEGRSLERTPRPATGTVRADTRAVQQILLNLGTNAIKYGRARSPIRIEVEHRDGRARIGITDHGVGIPADQLDRIFEPFVQLAPADAGESSRGGLGLGLSISRDLARAMGGDLNVSSVPGQGSTFVLELPALPAFSAG